MISVLNYLFSAGSNTIIIYLDISGARLVLMVFGLPKLRYDVKNHRLHLWIPRSSATWCYDLWLGIFPAQVWKEHLLEAVGARPTGKYRMIWPQMRSIWFTSLLSIELSFLSSNIIISTISMSILPGPKLLWGFGLFNLKLVRPNHLWHESSEVDPLCPIGVGSQAALASCCEMDPVKINIAIKFDLGKHVFLQWFSQLQRRTTMAQSDKIPLTAIPQIRLL